MLLCEDHKLSIIAFIIVQSQCTQLFHTVEILKNFVASDNYEESGALVTFETAIGAILKDA